LAFNAVGKPLPRKEDFRLTTGHGRYADDFSMAQIIATGFAGLRFLRQSHRQMTEDFINVYGNYAIKLLRLQNDMIQTFDRYQRGNKQTVEVRHVHIHSGGQGVVGIINPPGDREGGGQE
jgi:hypothetical protein